VLADVAAGRITETFKQRFPQLATQIQQALTTTARAGGRAASQAVGEKVSGAPVVKRVEGSLLGYLETGSR
jgi:hypothetical protein